MVILGIDAHKRTHTVVAVDERRPPARRRRRRRRRRRLIISAMVRWAERFGPERAWAVEDCRHLSRRLEADLLAAGERIVRVPPKLMAHARDSARTYGKSDPIDALAVARAALREPDLPDRPARRPGPGAAAAGRSPRRPGQRSGPGTSTGCAGTSTSSTRAGTRPARSLTSYKHLDASPSRLAGDDGMVARIAAELVARIRELTVDTNEPSSARSPSGSRHWRRRCWPSSVSARSPPPRSSARSPTSAGSRARTPSPATTAPRRCRCGPATANATGSPAPATANSTPPSTASPSPRPADHPDANAFLDRRIATRQHRNRSPPRPQATPLRRRLPSPPRRRRTGPPRHLAQPLDIGADDAALDARSATGRPRGPWRRSGRGARRSPGRS